MPAFHGNLVDVQGDCRACTVMALRKAVAQEDPLEQAVDHSHVP